MVNGVMHLIASVSLTRAVSNSAKGKGDVAVALPPPLICSCTSTGDVMLTAECEGSGLVAILSTDHSLSDGGPNALVGHENGEDAGD